jgi:hypothetical protein
MKSKILTAVAMLALLTLSSVPTVAQIQTGSILVRVTDEQQAVVAGVTVTISSPMLVAAQVVGITDAGGAYRLPALVPGLYALKLELQGFETTVRENAVVNAGRTTVFGLVLKVAGVAETVTVTGESPTIDTTSANVSVMLDQDILQGTPGGRDILSLLEYKVPGLVIRRPDVGGASAGMQSAFTAKGTISRENTQWLNGLNVANSGFPGNLGFYYDYDAFEEVQVSTGAHDLSVPTSGVFVNMVSRSGGDRWAGKAFYTWQGEATQGSNVDQELLQQGLRPDAGASDLISDATFQIGGPVVQNKLRLFTAFRDWRIHVRVPGFPVPETTDMLSGLAKLNYQINDRNRLTGFYSRQHRAKHNRNANALLTEESTWKEDDRFWITQMTWNSIVSDNAFLEAAIGYQQIFFPALQKGSEQSLLDLSSGLRTRAAPVSFLINWPRLQSNANLQYFVPHALGGRHELRVGIQYWHAPTKNVRERIDDLDVTYRSTTNTASTVNLWNSPRDARANVDELAIYFQDSYTVNRLTATGGVRWERTEGSLPAQSSPSSRWFPDAPREFDAVDNVPLWTTLAPRVSVVFDVQGDGKTAVKAAVGRYYGALSTGTVNNTNPNFDFSETYRWNDLNGDLRFQESELGELLSARGGRLTSFDPDVERGYTTEYMAGVEHELLPDLKLSAFYTHRRERDRLGRIDVGVPFSAYNQVSVTDRGRDGLLGTADDAEMFVFDQDPDTLGQNRFVIDNSSVFDQDYNGLEITATKRLRDRWQMLAGYTWSRTIHNAEEGITVNPNTLINSKGVTRLHRPHSFKVVGTYMLPHDVVVSGNFRTQGRSGVYQVSGTFGARGDNTRRETFRLTQGNVTVNAEEKGNDTFSYLTTMDLRVAKVLRLGGAKELEVMVDIYNLTNANTLWSVRTLTGRTNVQVGGSGEVSNLPNYRLPVFILAPRIFRLGASFRF